MQMEKIGVVGCGLMGSGIAEVCARQGLSVVVVDADETAVKAGEERVNASLDNAVRRGKLDAAAATAAREALTFASDMSALADRQLVVEAVTEDETVKTSIFRALDDVMLDPNAILASNTSSIPIMKLAMATRRPSQVVGLHFFNPVPVLPLVELLRHLRSDLVK
jgi:3-hydroxybutyryl-CoA dehydrogenase